MARTKTEAALEAAELEHADDPERAELLSRTGAMVEARDAYDMAIGLERDPAIRRFLLARRAACAN